jgi:DNA-binding IclR family transcriptional regulator
MSTEIAAATVLPGAGRNQSLGRAFELLECLASHPAGASVATLTREIGLPRATVTRLLGSLADAGAVARSREGREWVLGPTILRLSRAPTPVAALRDRARPLLAQLAAATEETAMLAVPTGPASAQVIDEVQGSRIVGAKGWIGRSLRSPASGFVRQLLADLPETELARVVASLELTALTPRTIVTRKGLLEAVAEIRRDGHTVVVDQYELGLAGIGVPVRRGDELVAMISIYMPTSRLDDSMRTRALALLRGAAEEVSAA